MPTSSSDSAADLSLLTAIESGVASPASIAHDVMILFDEWTPPLLRYVASFGLTADEADDVVQDVFLALFRHLSLRRSRSNLRGWLFQVAHNLALKQRKRNQTTRTRGDWEDADLAQHADGCLNPEERLVVTQRRQQVRSVLRALSEQDRQCVHLRAQGLRYREIAATLGISLGAVAKSLARSVARLVNADRR